MRLKIEEWADNYLCGDGIELMKEAIVCYKTGVYRAAFLMSYLAFKTSIKEKVLITQKPDTINEKCWCEQVIEPLRNDSKWEEKMNDLVERACADGNGLSAVFRFSNYERVKNRYNFWKNIRNSCAHAKSEKISSATVEHFWEYMMDDFSEYYVAGAAHCINEKLVESYLYYYTVGDEGINNLLNEITLVYKKNAKECFDNLFAKCPYCLSLNDRDVSFWKNIINNKNEIIRYAFADFFIGHIDYFAIWYRHFPQIFTIMYEKDRTFIQRVLSPWLEGNFYFEGEVLWKLLLKILQLDSKLIELNKVTSDYQKLKQLSQVSMLDEYEKEVFRKNKIPNLFLKNAGKDYFINNSNAHQQYYQIGSDKNDMYLEKCFEMIEWDLDLVNKINNACGELRQSMEWRSNQYAIQNGEARKLSYRRVLIAHKEKLLAMLHKEGRDISDFEEIQKLLSCGEENA